MHEVAPANPILSPDMGKPRRVLVLGSTGTIGRAVVHALVQRGHEVVCFVRPLAQLPRSSPTRTAPPQGVGLRYGDVTDPASLARDGFAGEHFDALVSCIASRTGAPADAWAIDYQAHVDALEAAKAVGVTQMVLLSAMCVQRPLLAFQHAKLAFEKTLIESGITYSIVRPTAFFKSLSGQVERVKQGKPFLVFGDGRLTACKPISDNDLAQFIVGCLDDPTCADAILPIGGPGDAITPRDQGEQLFALLGRKPKFTHVPVALLDAIIVALSTLGRVSPALAAKAELARIGRYYATQSMLVLNPLTRNYDAALTPSTGSQTLYDHYAKLIAGTATTDRGDHAVF